MGFARVDRGILCSWIQHLQGLSNKQAETLCLLWEVCKVLPPCRDSSPPKTVRWLGPVPLM